MRKFFSTLVFLLLLTAATWAQNITLYSYSSEGICVGSVLSISFTTSGTFAPNNTFRLQYSTDYGSTYVDQSGSFISSPASLTVPSMNGRDPYLVYRIISTSPRVVSSSSASVRLVRQATAHLTGASNFPAYPVNPYTPGTLGVRLSGGGSYTITLQDSTRSTLTGSTEESQFSLLINPARTTAYQLASVRNACGLGIVSQTQTPVLVNDVGFRILTNRTVICKGEPALFDYSTSVTLPQTPSFAGELIHTSSGRSVAIPVSGTTSPIQVSIPDDIPESSEYQLRIYDKRNGISAFVGLDGQRISIQSAPTVSLVRGLYERFNPLPAEAVALQLQVAGLADGSVVLSNGLRLPTNNWSTITVNPNRITSYSIVSVSGQCSSLVKFGNRSVTIDPRPGVVIDSLSADEVCAGTPVTVYYTATSGFQVPDRLRVRLDLGGVGEATVTRPGEAVFTMSSSTTPVRSSQLWLLDATTDAVIGMTTSPFTVRTRPTAQFRYSTSTLFQSDNWWPEVIYAGGGNIRVRLASGHQFALSPISSGFATYNTSLPAINVTQTSTFTLVAAENECGVTSLSSTATVTVQSIRLQSPRLLLSAASQVRNCPGAAVEFNMQPVGTFAADNQFQVQLSNASGVHGASLSVLSGAGRFVVTLPQQPGNYNIRVVSTNPVVSTDFFTLTVSQAVPGATISLYNDQLGLLTTNNATTVAAGQQIRVSYGLQGVWPIRYELANGMWGIAQDNSSTIFPTNPMQTTVYGLRSITDACDRTLTNPASATAIVTPCMIQRSGSISACIERPVLFPFTIDGILPPGGTFSVQISDDNLIFRNVPTTGTSSPLSVLFPKTMAGQKLYYRIAYQMGSTTTLSAPPVSGEQSPSLSLLSVPDVRLTGPFGATAVQLRNGSAALTVTSSPQLSWSTVYLNNGQQTNVDFSGQSTGLVVRELGEYSIGTAYNSCGFGTASGTVRVVREAVLSRADTKAGYCEDEPISVTYAVSGDFEPANKFTIYLQNRANLTRQLVGESTLMGSTVTINSGLKAGSYVVQVVSSAPSTTMTWGTPFLIQRPVSVSLTTQNVAAYQGDQISLPIRATGDAPFSLTLSTGEVVTVTTTQVFLPQRVSESTSYSVIQAANGCSSSPVSGVVSVSAIPVGRVALQWVSLYGEYCSGKVIRTEFLPSGTFGTDNTYTLLMSDAMGHNFQPIGTTTNPLALTGLIPANTTPADRYVFRVASSNPAHIGPTFGPVPVGQTPTGVLTGNATIFKGDSTRLSVALAGTSPWQLTITDLFGARTFTTSQSPFSLTVRPDTTMGYRLIDVRTSQCGAGSASGTALITVQRVLATEPMLPLEIRTWPNPVAHTLLIVGELPTSEPVLLTLHSTTGTMLQQTESRPIQKRLSHQLDVKQLSTGVYVLTATQGNRRSQFKMLKE